MRIAEYGRLDAVAMAELVRRREVSPRELVDEAIELHRARRPTAERGGGAALRPGPGRGCGDSIPDGPFRGVPFATKNLLAPIAGVPIDGGSRFFRGHVAARDSTLVSRYRKAGLVFVATTNAPELGLLPFTEPELHGPTRNPYDPARTPGGSSGGAAALVASGALPLAHANDGGGSIRIPASCCNLFGLKPSRGRMPVGPDYQEIWHGFVCDHVVSRTVRDSAAALDVAQGPEPGALYHAPPPERPYLEEVRRPPRRLRIALSVTPHLPARVDPRCAEAALAAGRLCESLGHVVEEAAPELHPRELAKAFFTIVVSELAADIRRAEQLMKKKARARDFEDATWLVALLAREVSAADFATVDGAAAGCEPPGVGVPGDLRRSLDPHARPSAARNRRAVAEGTGEAGPGDRRGDLVVAAPDARWGHRCGGGPGLRVRPLHAAGELLGAAGDVRPARRGGWAARRESSSSDGSRTRRRCSSSRPSSSRRRRGRDGGRR